MAACWLPTKEPWLETVVSCGGRQAASYRLGAELQMLQCTCGRLITRQLCACRPGTCQLRRSAGAGRQGHSHPHLGSHQGEAGCLAASAGPMMFLYFRVEWGCRGTCTVALMELLSFWSQLGRAHCSTAASFPAHSGQSAGGQMSPPARGPSFRPPTGTVCCQMQLLSLLADQAGDHPVRG